MNQPSSSSAIGECGPVSLRDLARDVPSEAGIRPSPASPVRLAISADPGVPKLRVARRENNDSFERDYLLRVLAATNQNVTRAAKLAGVSRQQIQRLMIKHRVRRGEPRA